MLRDLFRDCNNPGKRSNEHLNHSGAVRIEECISQFGLLQQKCHTLLDFNETKQNSFSNSSGNGEVQDQGVSQFGKKLFPFVM